MFPEPGPLASANDDGDEADHSSKDGEDTDDHGSNTGEDGKDVSGDESDEGKSDVNIVVSKAFCEAPITRH